MQTLKEYTQEEFEQRLLDLYGSDFAGLAALVEKMNRWLSRGDRVGEYMNGELNPNSFWDRRYHALDPRVGLREEIADSQGSSRRYRLEGVYSGEEIKIGDLLKRVKIERPAVVFVDAGFDTNGVARRAWVLYHEDKLYRVIHEGPEYGHLWEDYGYPQGKEWSSGKIPITGEVWDQLWDKTEWPTTHGRFSDYVAEELYSATLSSFQDEDVSSEDWGTSAYLFKEDLKILYCDSQGSVTYETFGDADALQTKWDEIEAQYYPEDEEED